LQITSKLKANERNFLEESDIMEGKHPKQVTTFHHKHDAQFNVVGEVAFDLDENESLGTQKFYTIAPFILKAIETGLPLIIDELEAQLHPKLTKQIIEIFNNPETNPKNAQLLAITHDTNLLSAKLFRRDQILFVEKDKYGASHLYSLAEFKGVRNDASFENDYLMGRYGAVPFLNLFRPIVEP
jgi:AAA15 family ATPase/GTPase